MALCYGNVMIMGERTWYSCQKPIAGLLLGRPFAKGQENNLDSFGVVWKQLGSQ